MSADPQTMDSSFVIPAPGGHPCTYQAFDSTAVTRAAPRAGTRTRLVTTLAFAALVALDAFEPVKYVSGSWWLVLLIAWLMPWPGDRLAAARPPRFDWSTGMSLVAITVFGWLYLRAGVSIGEPASYFEPIDLDGKLHALNYVLQDLLTGVLMAALLARPLHRTFGRDSTAIAFVVATPWFILTCTDTVFDIARWSDKPLSNALWLFEATLPPLLLAEACSLLSVRTAGRQRPDRARSATFAEFMSALFERWPRWLATSAVQPLLMLTLCGLGLRFGVDDIRSLRSTASFAVLFVTSICGLLLTAAVVHELRHYRRRRAGMNRWARFRTCCTAALVSCVLVPLWLWIFLVDAPLAEYYARESLASLPGPAWTISYDANNQTLSLSGEYQFGTASAFANALDSYPDTRRVALSGPGGRLREGLAIAHVIESRGLDTRVRSDCVSACTLAFIAGRERTMRTGAALGFHAVSSPIGFLDEYDNEYSRYLTSRGVDIDFIRRAAETPNDGMWYPTNDRLLEAGVITAVD
jgi:hypothetical protein